MRLSVYSIIIYNINASQQTTRVSRVFFFNFYAIVAVEVLLISGSSPGRDSSRFYSVRNSFSTERGVD